MILPLASAVATNLGQTPPAHDLHMHRVVVALDGSPVAERAIALSSVIADTFGGPLTLVRVLESRHGNGELRGLDAFAWEAERNQAHDYLSHAQQRLEQAGASVDVSLMEGAPAEQVLSLAQQVGANLLLVTSHGQGGPSRWRLGSTAQKITNRADASILLVPVGPDALPLDESNWPRRVLVPLDCSQRAECVLPLVMRIAAHRGAKVILVHAAPAPELPRVVGVKPDDAALAESLTRRNLEEGERYLSGVAARLAGSGLDVEIRTVVSRRLARTIDELAEHEQADLIVVNAHGKTGDPRDVFGGVTGRLLETTRIPLLVARDLTCSQFQGEPVAFHAQWSLA